MTTPGGDGFDYPVEAVRAGGRAGERCGEGVRGVDLGGTASGIGTALPGSRSAGSATALGDSWTRGIRGLAEDLRSHGDALRESATTTEGTDTASASEIGPTMPGPVRPPIVIPGLP